MLGVLEKCWGSFLLEKTRLLLPLLPIKLLPLCFLVKVVIMDIIMTVIHIAILAMIVNNYAPDNAAFLVKVKKPQQPSHLSAPAP